MICCYRHQNICAICCFSDAAKVCTNYLVNLPSSDPTVNSVEEVLVALRRVIRATDIYSKKLAKTTGLTAPQMLLLQTIRAKGELTIGELATAMSLSQATVTTVMDRLEKRHLVSRQRSTVDKRKVHARLTLEASKILEQAPIPLQQNFSTRFNVLDEWEQTMIISSLQRVAKMMDAEHIDASPVLDVGAIDRHAYSVENVEK